MVGVILAEEAELNEIIKLMIEKEEIRLYNNIFYKGIIEEKEIICTKCNVGKVNSARICQMMIDKFNIDIIFNVGTAGSVNNELNIGDVLVATKLIQYDFDVTAFGRKPGEIENIGEYIEINPNLKDLFQNIDIKFGVIASGDKFIYDKNEKDKIRNIFGADAIEMEGASIAQVCYLDNIPFIVIRSITDKLDGSSKVEFNNFLESSSKNAANIFKEVLKKI